MSDCKWIVVMGVEEYRKSLNEIFLKSGIVVFSEVQVKGFRFTQNQLANENAPLNIMDPVYSVISFALTKAEHAKAFLEEIDRFNKSNERARPLHAFQVNVEAMV